MMLKCYLRPNVLARYAARHNLSMRQLAHRLGYDSAQLSNWLRHKRAVSPRARALLQRVTHGTWDELFYISRRATPTVTARTAVRRIRRSP